MTFRIHVLIFLYAFFISGLSLASDDPINFFEEAEERLWQDVETSCKEALSYSETLNAVELFVASVDCSESGAISDQAYLRALGQVRAVTDLEMFKPLDSFEEIVMGNLAVALGYRFSALAEPKNFRDPNFFQELESRVNAWLPLLEANYFPGWEYRNDLIESDYFNTLHRIRREFLAEISLQATILQNDRYFFAYEESREIMARNSNSLSPEDADYQRFTELSELLAEVVTDIREAYRQKNKTEIIRGGGYIPDESDPFRQVYSGMNGPEKFTVNTFFSASDVEFSWLAMSIPKAELTQILMQVDFSTEVLVALASGRRETATGNIYIVDASFNDLTSSWSVRGRVGVNQEGCAFAEEEKNPFAVVIADRPGKIVSPSKSITNFPDRCQN